MSEHPAATIVVVDDNDGTRYATSRILRDAGFNVVEATRGYEALERVDASTDLVVLDVNMPDIDGFEVCRRLRKSPLTSHVPVVHLSATFMDDKDRVYGLEAGADGYLTHPVEPQVLVATIGSFLRAPNAEMARRAADAKLRVVFDLVTVGIAMLDEALEFRDANNAFCQLVKLPREALIGRRFDALPFSLGLDRTVLQHTRAAGGSSWSGTLPLIRGHEEPLDIEWHLSFEAINGLSILSATNVTQKKRAEQERELLLASERAARSDAQRATSLKDEFLATVSHELRNPLASILGWTEVLLRDPERHVKQGLLAIQRGARLQQQLVADLLDISAMLAGKVYLEMSVVDLHGVVNHAVDVVQAAADTAAVKLEWTCPRARCLYAAIRFACNKSCGIYSRIRSSLRRRTAMSACAASAATQTY